MQKLGELPEMVEMSKSFGLDPNKRFNVVKKNVLHTDTIGQEIKYEFECVNTSNLRNKSFFDDFVIFNYNRVIDYRHVDEIAGWISSEGYMEEFEIFVTPINNKIYPGKYVILDGQHRYLACVKLDCIFTFKIVNVIEHKDIIDRIAINNNRGKNMVSTDYLTIFKDNTNYKRIEELIKSTGFSITDITFVCNNFSRKKSKDLYMTGNFSISDSDFNKVIEISILNNIIKSNARVDFRNIFVRPLIHMYNDERVIISHLSEQLEKYSYKLIKGNIDQNIIGLYNTYNERLRVDGKIERLAPKFKNKLLK